MATDILMYPTFRGQQTFEPTSNDCIRPSQVFYDYEQTISPSQSSHSHSQSEAQLLQRNQPSDRLSSIATSPMITSIDEDAMPPLKPSHDYGRYKQQTGLPPGSIAGLNQPFNGSNSFMNSYGSQTGLDDMDMDVYDPINAAHMNASMLQGWTGSSLDASIDMGVSTSPLTFNPADPFGMGSPVQMETPTARAYPGMHSQAALAQAQRSAPMSQQLHPQRQMQQQQQQQQQPQQQQQNDSVQQTVRHHPNRSSVPSHISEAQTQETIARVVNKIRQESQKSLLSSQDDLRNNAPHITRMKKDEEDMDEDEKLLASEEGKKLTSKERRQLRNKVSARAFRSRRKEYITHLEGELNVKGSQVHELTNQNNALVKENAGFRDFISLVLARPEFKEFLHELSENPNAVPTMLPVASSSNPTPVPTQSVNRYCTSSDIGQAAPNFADLGTLTADTLRWSAMNPNAFQPSMFSMQEQPEESLETKPN